MGEFLGYSDRETAIGHLASEFAALKLENERLKAGGCARDQRTTQFCAEAVAMANRIAELEAKIERVRVLPDWWSVAPLGYETLPGAVRVQNARDQCANELEEALK